MLFCPSESGEGARARFDTSLGRTVTSPPPTPCVRGRIQAFQVILVPEFSVAERGIALGIDDAVARSFKCLQACHIALDDGRHDSHQAHVREKIPRPCLVNVRGDTFTPVVSIKNQNATGCLLEWFVCEAANARRTDHDSLAICDIEDTPDNRIALLACLFEPRALVFERVSEPS